MLNCSFDQGRVVLEGEMQVAYLDGLRDCLQEAMPCEQAVELDLGQVASLDVAGLQLLLAFLQSRRAIGPASLKKAPPVFYKTLELSGLDRHFADFLEQ
jgi:ABC-type transporter Mla MlaB component